MVNQLRQATNECNRSPAPISPRCAFKFVGLGCPLLFKNGYRQRYKRRRGENPNSSHFRYNNSSAASSSDGHGPNRNATTSDAHSGGGGVGGGVRGMHRHKEHGGVRAHINSHPHGADDGPRTSCDLMDLSGVEGGMK